MNLEDDPTEIFIEPNLYPRLANYVPSATRQGADALMQLLKQKEELYSIEEKEMGQIDEIIGEYLRGKVSINEIHRISGAVLNSQTQVFSKEQIGKVEDIVPSAIAISTNVDYFNCNTLQDNRFESQSDEQFLPQPPLLRSEQETKNKILVADEKYPSLNNHTMFISLSDKLFDRYCDFFFAPHYTKVIWSTHKVVYVFTHISSQVSLYYDIDLKESLSNGMTGGHSIISTTIITKTKIFVPIVPEMYEYFNMRNKGKLEFYVRFNTLSS